METKGKQSGRKQKKTNSAVLFFFFEPKKKISLSNIVVEWEVQRGRINQTVLRVGIMEETGGRAGCLVQAVDEWKRDERNK